jgi:hypothetical protein
MCQVSYVNFFQMVLVASLKGLTPLAPLPIDHHVNERGQVSVMTCMVTTKPIQVQPNLFKHLG